MLALAALLVVIGGGHEQALELRTLRVQEPRQQLEVRQVREAKGGMALDVATPDRIYGRFVPDIRVAGAGDLSTLAVGRAPDPSPESGTGLLVELPEAAPPEGGVDGEVTRVLRQLRETSQADATTGVPPRFEAYLTIYCCRNDPGGAYCGLTASGVQVAPGMAACSNTWDFGTRFLINAEYVVTCADRGGAVTQPNHLDVFFDDCGDQEDPAPGTGWAWLQATGTRVMVEVIAP